MKKFILFLFVLLFGCSPTEKDNTSNNIKEFSDTKITYDTTVIKSKKVNYSINRDRQIAYMRADSLSGNKSNVITVKVKPINVTREKRVLKVSPNIEQTSKNLTGRLNYLVSDTMEVGVTNVVSVSISINMNKEMVISKVSTFRHYNNVITEIIDTIIRVTPEMIVRLQEIGTVGNFHIDTITPTKQVIELSDTTLTQWQWKVTPLKDGNKVLTITVDLVIDGVEKNLNIYDGKIYVHMKNKIWITIVNFFFDNWKWLWTAIFIPLFVWLFKTYILKKKTT
jgi:hypothetical protein